MHAIEYFSYDEKTPHSKIALDIAEYADEHSDYEGQCRRIEFHNETICENESAADKFIYDHDDGWYDNHAVRFYSYPALKKNKRMEVLEERLQNLKSRLLTLENTKYAETLTSTEFVGCKECGSKIATKYLKTNCCPVCHADMRPKTTLDKIAKLNERIADTKKEYKEEETKQQAKQRNKAKVKWLVKIEYHC